MKLDAVMECSQFPEKNDIEHLSAVLKFELDRSANSGIVEYQQRQLIEEIINYVGEDPLKPWIRFVKWAKDMCGSRGKSKLLPLLELCTKTFLNHKEYCDDLRYLRIWVRYADCCSDPLKMFATMEERQIGQIHSLFYEAYAVELEIHRDLSKANEVYIQGLLRHAQPLDRLKKMYKKFLERNKKLVKHLQKGLTSIKSATQPLSTLPNNQFNLLERSDLSQYHSKNDSISQMQQNTTSESQQVLYVFVDKEDAREAKNPGKNIAHHNCPRQASSFDRITSNVDGRNMKGKREAMHDIHVRPTQVGAPDILPSAYGETFSALREHEACQAFVNKSNKATTELQDLSFNSIKGSKRRADLYLNEGSALNQVDALDVNQDSSTTVSKDRTATVHGCNILEGEMEDLLKKTRFSSEESLPFHGDETMAIKKFVDVAIASRIDPNEGHKVERHHGLVDPTINTKEAMADILSLFNKPLPFQRSHKQAFDEPNCQRALNEGSQSFSVLADDRFNSSQVGRQDEKDKLETSKSMDFVVLVDDDLKESYRCPSTLDSSMNMEHMQEEKFQISKMEKPTAFPGVLSNKFQQVADGQCSHKMNFIVYADDHPKYSSFATDDAKHKDKENRTSLTDLPEKLDRAFIQENEGLVGNCTLFGRVNPWDENVLEELLNGLSPPLDKYEGFVYSNKNYNGSAVLSTLKNSERNKSVELGSTTYHLKGCTGQGAFARVYQAYDDDCEKTVVLKIQKPPCPWEFYIYKQLDKRIHKEERDYFGYAWKMHVYADFSIMVADYGRHGTLQDVINSYLATNRKMEQVLCMYYTIEMLHMLETLHSVGIIHADIKPDNLLIRNESKEWEEWTPNRSGCWKHQGLCLIDWGRSIDTTLYPEGTEFVGDSKTSAFRCIEMVEKKPWSFQVDTYGLCGVVHCMLHGSYMELEVIHSPHQQRSYRPKAPFKRYWNRELWHQFFTTLLNIESCKGNPSLGSLRKLFEDYLIDNPSQAKRIKELLMKQSLMMYSHH